MKFPHEIKSITVLETTGTDKVIFTFDGPTPYPELAAEFPDEDYGPVFSVETRKGYAKEWLEKAGLWGEFQVKFIRTTGSI